MIDESRHPGRGAKQDRAERLKAALRDNLKRRKAQARGRAGMAIVTPEDDVRAQAMTDDADGPPGGGERSGFPGGSSSDA